jgi:hypothetical protein
LQKTITFGVRFAQNYLGFFCAKGITFPVNFLQKTLMVCFGPFKRVYDKYDYIIRADLAKKKLPHVRVE